MLRFVCCKTGTGGFIYQEQTHTDLCQELWLRGPPNLTVRADMLLVKASWVVIRVAQWTGKEECFFCLDDCIETGKIWKAAFTKWRSGKR